MGKTEAPRAEASDTRLLSPGESLCSGISASQDTDFPGRLRHRGHSESEIAFPPGLHISNDVGEEQSSNWLWDFPGVTSPAVQSN